MVFIDGSNLYHILKDFYGTKLAKSDPSVNLDFQKFVEKLSKGGKLIRTYYYNAILDQGFDKEMYGKQQRFFEELRKIPNFEVIACRMQKNFIKGKDGKKGRTEYTVKEDDIHIAVDMVRLAFLNAYDTAILVSSDGDFVPAIDAVKGIGKRVENVGFPNKFSWHLRNKCDRFIKFEETEILDCQSKT